jgi:hypothetical protein
MSEILRQIDEDLRKDRVTTMVKKNGIYIFTTIFLAICIVAGYQIMQTLQNKNYANLVEIYIKANNTDRIEESINNLEELKSQNNYIGVLSKIKSANLHMQNGNLEYGQSILRKIAISDNYDTTLKDLSIYYLLLSQLNNLSEIEINTYLTKNKLEKSEFRFLYKEIIALNKLNTKNYEEAIKAFEDIVSDPSAPRDLIIRASKFLDTLD